MFKNKTVLITGASRGIGRATALEFARLSANVIVNYVSDEKSAMATAAECEKLSGAQAIAIKADVSDEAAVKNMIAAAIEKFGRIDVLVNNAGITIDKDFADRTLEDWQKTFATNLFGMFLVSKYVGEHMVANKYGKIINVSSTNGIYAASPYSLDYDASKAGIINLTKNLVVQFSPHVNVNAVAPGWVNTDMNKDLPADYMAAETEKFCLKRIAEPSEMATIIRFLASDDASYINGTVIIADGGRL